MAQLRLFEDEPPPPLPERITVAHIATLLTHWAGDDTARWDELAKLNSIAVVNVRLWQARIKLAVLLWALLAAAELAIDERETQ